MIFPAARPTILRRQIVRSRPRPGNFFTYGEKVARIDDDGSNFAPIFLYE